MSGSVEDNARSLLRIFAKQHVGVGGVLMLDYSRTLFTRATQLGAAEYDAALDYALEKGWVTKDWSQVKLEEAGAAATPADA